MAINRFPRTDFNKINLDWLMRNLKQVKEVTDNIGTAVEDAQQAASEATTAAAGAVEAATEATQAAEEAVEAIETVTTQAAQAVQTANAASATATGASNTAATALSRAATAQAAAETAQTMATTAQTTGTGALAQADLAREETAALNNRFPVSIADGGTGATDAATARENLGAESAIEHGTANGWEYWKYADGHIVAFRTISTTLSHYTYNNVYYGYYIPNIETPFTMRDLSYYIGCDWSIGSGFGIPAGRLSITTSSFNAYGLATSSGSLPVSLRMLLVGYTA